MVIRERGGGIQIGEDKTNNYDFFYRQNVIKPALVGLLGPWISGGVEFNWPQHHRPSTFMPVDHKIEKHEDGRCTVWLSEHEPMNRMKGMVGITLHPGMIIDDAPAWCTWRIDISHRARSCGPGETPTSGTCGTASLPIPTDLTWS